MPSWWSKWFDMACRQSLVPAVDISRGVELFQLPGDAETEEIWQSSTDFHFHYVKTNIPGPGCDESKFTESFAGCSCQGICTYEHCSCLQLFGSAYDSDGRINTIILESPSPRPVLECGNDCSCDRNLCGNRIVQKGISQKLEVFHSNRKRLGLKLAAGTEKGAAKLSFVCEYAGEVISKDEARRRVKLNETLCKCNYLIALRECVAEKEIFTYIDPQQIGNAGRFINHSCDPNLIMVPVRVNHQIPRLALFARRDIEPGEELTFDYSGETMLSNPCCKEELKINAASVSSQRDTNICDDTSYVKKHDVCSSSLQEGMHLNQVPSTSSCNTDTEPPDKKTKFSTAAAAESDPIQNDDPVYSNTFVGLGNEECHKEETVHISFSKAKLKVKATGFKYDKSKGQSVTESKVNDFEATTSSSSGAMDRKPCYCGSSCCKGFLPFDSNLLCN